MKYSNAYICFCLCFSVNKPLINYRTDGIHICHCCHYQKCRLISISYYYQYSNNNQRESYHTPCSRILSVSHLSSLRYSRLEARQARSITKAYGVALSNIDNACNTSTVVTLLASKNFQAATLGKSLTYVLVSSTSEVMSIWLYRNLIKLILI